MENSATKTRWTSLILLLALGIFTLALCAVPTQATAEEVTRELKAGDEFTNTIDYDNDDEDIITISAPKGGYVYFELTILSDGDAIGYEIWSDYTYYSSGNIYSGDGTTSIEGLCLPEGQIIELRITPHYGCKPTYRIKAITEMPDNFEIEPNDTRDKASALTLNGITRGISNQNQSKYDEDYFSYTASNGGYYTLQARIVSDDSSVDIATYIGDKAYEEETAYTDSGWIDCGTVSLNSGRTFYVKVTSTYGNYSDLYELKLTYKPFEKSSSKSGSSANKSSSSNTSTIAAPGAVSLKSVKAQSKSFVAKWSKGKNIDGYQVRYSTSKSMAKAKYKAVSSSKVKLTVKKLKSKKRYYVQVRTYAKHSNPSKTYYSDWSNLKSVKVK